MKAFLKILPLALLGLLPTTEAAIVVTASTNAAQLANAVTSSGAAGIVVTSSSLDANTLPTGETSSGFYTLTGPLPDTYGLKLPGVIISSGNVLDYGTGPFVPGQTTAYGVPATAAQEALLGPITGASQHFDCTELDITFNTLPGVSTVFFQVVFGSEEWPDFVGEFVDGFGLFLNGSNIAFAAGQPINIDNSDMAAIAGTALTGVLSIGGTNEIIGITAAVPAGSVANKLTFIIADSLDDVLDTTAYISALGGGVPTTLPPVTCTPHTVLPQHSMCITRTAQYWFTHSETNNENAVTLKRAIEASGGTVCLGFQTLPVEFENNDNVKDAEDALIEALGFYWRSDKFTGEQNGTQSQKLPGSPLCTARKQLAVQLIAAMANNALLGSSPANCMYFNGVSETNFPSDLIEQAGVAIKGVDITADRTITALLLKFNNAGQTNNFVNGLEETSPIKSAALKKLSRDPTTQLTCPGINETADQAAAITSFPFTQTVNLTQYISSFPSSTCGQAGPNAVWLLTPDIAVASSEFTVSATGNVVPIVSVWTGSSTNGFTSVTCASNPVGHTTTTFTADGVSTYYIVLGGANGTVGRLTLKVNSP